mgnify:CR=1 FL=1
MKKLLVIIISVATVLMAGCVRDKPSAAGNEPSTPSNYKQAMRDFVQDIHAYAKGIKADFIIIPQNGHQLITENGEATGNPATKYLGAIDGVGREDLFYGYEADDQATPESERNAMIAFMDIVRSKGLQVLVTDYCSTPWKIDDSYSQSAAKGYISFAANHRELDNIPSYPSNPYNVNTDNITSLSQAKNFLYLLDDSNFPSKTAFLSTIQATKHDVVIIDLFYEGNQEAFSSSDIASLKTKAGGGSRLVIAYMSIGEAEDYRYYWKAEWKTNPPSWLAGENPDWPHNYKVRYWDENWQGIIYGNNNSYLKKILDAEFDGVYLDIIDAFEYFEGQ